MKVSRNKYLALVHIDTNFFAYGPEGEPHNRYMKSTFSKYKLTLDDILMEIEETLCECKDNEYKIVVGHHPIGPVCGKSNNLSLIQPLLKKYGY